jgi:hypothetical protein
LDILKAPSARPVALQIIENPIIAQQPQNIEAPPLLEMNQPIEVPPLVLIQAEQPEVPPARRAPRCQVDPPPVTTMKRRNQGKDFTPPTRRNPFRASRLRGIERFS